MLTGLQNCVFMNHYSERLYKIGGKLPISRRYDLLPLLPSGPDGIQRELAVWDLPPEKKDKVLAIKDKTVIAELLTPNN